MSEENKKNLLNSEETEKYAENIARSMSEAAKTYAKEQAVRERKEDIKMIVTIMELKTNNRSKVAGNEK